MSGITTHVLDTSSGKPAAKVAVRLAARRGDAWSELARGETDDDGRCRTLLPNAPIAPGLYRLTFAIGPYFAARNTPTFYPEVPIEFEVHDGAAHYHVPLLVSPWGYATYRGS